MTPQWLTATLPIAALYACRMLGLFIIIPVFTLFAPAFKGATPALIGVAFGAYGLAQACMQIPFGLLSDHYGRKPIISVGLLMLLIGSLMGTYVDSIWGMIFARSLQGFGAIGSVLMALLGDQTQPQDRAKSMAVIGVTIGLSFSLSILIAPLMTSPEVGLKTLFYFIAALATLGLFILNFFVTEAPRKSSASKIQLTPLKHCLQSAALQKLNLGIFVQHACLTALFYILPLRLQAYIQLGKLQATWHFYLPIVLLAFLLMAPLVTLAERRQKLKLALKASVGVLLCSQLLLSACLSHWLGLVTCVFIYFVAFNLLEALLPSQVSKQAPTEQRGTAMGIYSTAQFLGIFIGGALAGLIYPHFGETGVLLFNTLLCATWLITL